MNINLNITAMLTKLDRFSEALQKRNPDDALVRFFNDMYDEAESNARYIAEIEYTNLQLHLDRTSAFKHLAESQRLRTGVLRNIKQLRNAKTIKKHRYTLH